MRLAAVLLSLACLAPLDAASQDADRCVQDIRGNQVCGVRAGQCALDRYRNAWCAPDDGAAMKDRYDEVVCGAGACVRDARSGDISCVSAAGGAILTEPNGATACEGGCVPASRSACRRMTPG